MAVYMAATHCPAWCANQVGLLWEKKRSSADTKRRRSSVGIREYERPEMKTHLRTKRGQYAEDRPARWDQGASTFSSPTYYHYRSDRSSAIDHQTQAELSLYWLIIIAAVWLNQPTWRASGRPVSFRTSHNLTLWADSHTWTKIMTVDQFQNFSAEQLTFNPRCRTTKDKYKDVYTVYFMCILLILSLGLPIYTV